MGYATHSRPVRPHREAVRANGVGLGTVSARTVSGMPCVVAGDAQGAQVGEMQGHLREFLPRQDVIDPSETLASY